MSSERQLVPLDALQEADSPRLEGESQQHIEFLAQLPTALPPILVHRRTMRVIDGMHRVRAARINRQHAIEVQFFDGDEHDAFILAVKANQAHGLPLTISDREAAAVRIIASRPTTSDRWIADVTGLAPRTVAAIRQRVGAGNTSATRVGRDGRTRPLSSADGRRIASEVIARRPDASLREVAKAAGISPATAKDVRERMRRGADPVPAGQGLARDRLRRVEQAKESGQTLAQLPWRGRTGSARDRASLLHAVSKDPSLRLNEAGRCVIRWLFARASGPEGWQEMAPKIQSHSAYLVVELARACADEWLEFAAHLEQRVQSSA